MDEAQHNHDNKVRLVSAKMPPNKRLSDLADLFKVFGNSTRMADTLRSL